MEATGAVPAPDMRYVHGDGNRPRLDWDMAPGESHLQGLWPDRAELWGAAQALLQCHWPRGLKWGPEPWAGLGEPWKKKSASSREESYQKINMHERQTE